MQPDSSSRSYGNYLASERPLLDRIGAKNVNAVLLCLYTGFWGLGLATYFLIPIHANESWPLSLALAFVLSVGFVHALEIGIGAILVPNYVYYPVKPVWLFATADGVFFLCWVGILGGYIGNPSASTVPLLSTFFMDIAIPVYLYKCARLVFPDGFTVAALTGKGANNDTQPNPSLSFPGGGEYYEEYDEYEYEASAAPAAQKLAAMLKQQRAPNGKSVRPVRK